MISRRDGEEPPAGRLSGELQPPGRPSPSPNALSGTERPGPEPEDGARQLVHPDVASADLELAELGTLIVVSAPLGAQDKDPVTAYLAELGSSGSRRAMQGALAKMAALLCGANVEPAQVPWWELRREHTAGLRSLMSEALSPASVNKHLSALRGVLKASWELGLMSAEDYHRAAGVKSVKFKTLPAGRMLSAGELKALFGGCAQDESPAGARDASVLAVLFAGGLRRDEAARLELADYDKETGDLLVRHGKGRVQRNTYLSDGAQAALSHWLRWRGEEPGPLWTQVLKGGYLVLPPSGLSARAVSVLCDKRARLAGMKPFSPHDLRRTFISMLLDLGSDLATVQRLAGHASPSTTSRYDRRGEAAKKKAAKGLHVAYQRAARDT